MPPVMERPTEAVRYHAFDSARASMMLLGCVFHAALPYMVAPREFEDPPSHPVFDVVVATLHAFRMPVFFVMAGFFAALLVERRGVRRMLLGRAKRILLPFLAAFLLLSPAVRAAYAFAVAAEASGSVREGLEALEGFRWIRWTKAYHLWFLVSLTFFYPLALGVRRLAARAPARAQAALARILRSLVAGPWRALFLTVAVGAPFWGSLLVDGRAAKGALVQLTLLLFFGFGWLLYRWTDLLPRIEKGTWVALAVGLLFAPAATGILREPLEFGDPWAAARAAGVLAAFCVCMVLGVIGLFLKLFDRPSPAARYVSDASYWIYLVHYPLVVLLGGLLAPTSLPSAVKFLLVIGIATPLLLLSYHLGVRATVVGLFLNGRRYAGGAA